MDERMSRFQALLADEAFAGALLAAEDEQAAQKLLADKGVSMTIEELTQIGDLMKRAANGELTQEQLTAMQNGELSEDALENVAGGLSGANIAGIIGISATFMTIIGLGTLAANSVPDPTKKAQQRSW